MKQLNWYQIFGVQIPDGRTVLPTDDIQIWLHCGNIWDKNYTTLAEVLADSTTLSALISSNNAVDYLVRSTTWAIRTDLVPTMTSNTTPSGVCSCSSVHSATYDAYKAFDKSKSTLWHANADTGVYPQTLTYEFPTAQTIRSASLSPWYFNNGCRERTYKYQGSNDGVTYVDLTETITYQGSQTATVAGNGYAGSDEIVSFTKNIGSYKYYQLVALSGDIAEHKAAVVELSFYDNDGTAIIPADSTAMTYIGLNNYCANTLLADSTWRSAICNSAYFESVLNVKVPVMTSATTPSGVAFDNGSYNNNSPAWHSFSEQVNKYWVSPDGSGAGKYFGYEFTSAVKIFKAVIDSDASYATETYAFNSAKIQATNDNDWSAPIDLQSYNNPGLTNYSFIFNNPTAYSKYRWICTAYSGGKYYGGMKLQFYGREDV